MITLISSAQCEPCRNFLSATVPVSSSHACPACLAGKYVVNAGYQEKCNIVDRLGIIWQKQLGTVVEEAYVKRQVLAVAYNAYLLSDKPMHIGERFVKLTGDILIGHLNTLEPAEAAAQLTVLAERLSDLDLDLKDLLLAAREPWQVKALVDGAARNPLYVDTADYDFSRTELIISLLKVVKEEYSADPAAHAVRDEIEHQLASFKDQLQQKRLQASQQQSEQGELTVNFDLLAQYTKKFLKDQAVISWETLVHLSMADLALRHVSDIPTAEREKCCGVIGDAVAISNGISSLIQHLEKTGRLSLVGKHKELTELIALDSSLAKRDKLQMIMDSYPAPDRLVIAKAYQEALLSFIESSYRWDIGINDCDPRWLEHWINDLEKSTCFLLVRAAQTPPYDQKNYYHLGKLGKHRIAAAKMCGIIYPPKDVAALVSKGREMHSQEGDALTGNTKAMAWVMAQVRLHYLAKITALAVEPSDSQIS